MDPWSGQAFVPWKPGLKDASANDGREGQVLDYDGRWRDADDLRDFIRRSLAADRQRAQDADRHFQQGRENSKNWLGKRDAQLREEARREQEDKSNQERLDRIRDIADRLGLDDIWDRAVGSEGRAYRSNGSVDPRVVDQLQALLRNRLAQDMRQPMDDGYESPFDDFVNNTIDDVRHSTPIRVGLGILTNGGSELFFQPQSAYEAMKRAFDEAASKGQSFDTADALRSGFRQFAEDNLPINTIKALTDSNPESQKAGNIGSALLMDLFAALNTRDTARNAADGVNSMRRAKAGDLPGTHGNSSPSANGPGRSAPTGRGSEAIDKHFREGGGPLEAAGTRDAGSVGVRPENQIPIRDALSDVPTGQSRWAKSEFQGRRVYQRNDLIDPARRTAWKDPVTGQWKRGTNLERMRDGRAPIGPDGKPLELHHTTGREVNGFTGTRGRVAEITRTMHQDATKTLHIPNGRPNPNYGRGPKHPRQVPEFPSFRRDTNGATTQQALEFDTFRQDYWRNRARDFQAK